jgi:hypothetical protein
MGLPLCRTGAVVIALSSRSRAARVHVTCLLHSAISRNVEFEHRARVPSISFKLGKLSLRLLTCCRRRPVVKLRLVPPAAGTTEDSRTVKHQSKTTHVRWRKQRQLRTIPLTEFRAFILSRRRLAVRELEDECPVSAGGCYIF